MDIFPHSDIVIINKLILTTEIYSQCDVKHTKTLLIKTVTLEGDTDIITSIRAHPIGLAAILVIMCVLNFKTVVILYIFPLKTSHMIL